MLLTFPPSTSDMQVIVVPIVINDDSFVEGNETFNVMLGLPELDDPVNIDTDPLPVVIIDDDGKPGIDTSQYIHSQLCIAPPTCHTYLI